MSNTNPYKLYSITEAAREMHLGKDTLYGLISEGEIGTIKIGKRAKIPASEIERFQTENIVRLTIQKQQREVLIPINEKSKTKSLFRTLRQEILNGECL